METGNVMSNLPGAFFHPESREWCKRYGFDSETMVPRHDGKYQVPLLWIVAELISELHTVSGDLDHMTEVYCLFEDHAGSGESYGDLIGVYTSIEKAKDARPNCIWELQSGQLQWNGKWADEWTGPSRVHKEWHYYFVQPCTLDKEINDRLTRRID